jgi:hypothetical protein
MLSPRGTNARAVYWRRRVTALAIGVLLIVSVLFFVFDGPGGDNDTSHASPSPSTSSTSGASPGNGASTATGTPSATTSTSITATATSSLSTAATDVVPLNCAAASLKIAAATSAATYPVGTSVPLDIVITNIGTAPCVADLSDTQIVLTVFSGQARVWGSHDCQIAPGASSQTLPVNQPIRREIVWSGLSAVAGCAGTRQRVGAGTYTVVPYFAGTTGTTAMFAIA